MNPEIISVKEFIAILNETLTFAYPLVVVEGEVSGFKVNQGKWVFFDLKDDEATLGCFLPLYQLKVPLEDGMKVRVSGTPKLTKWGKFSFTARRVELAGEGELRRAFEILKTKLAGEGLFAPQRKRPLPPFPAVIGLVTSAQSAAYQDFTKILAARWGGVTVKVADVQVQGVPAPDQIVLALDYFNQLPVPIDVVVLIRGGGSLEDLQAFNTESVARAVAASRTPIVVGVGHEVDTSLADLAADVRAATPTDAARLVVPDRSEVLRSITHHQLSIESCLKRRIAALQQRLERHVNLAEKFLAWPRERVERLVGVLERDFSYCRTNLLRQAAQVGQLAKRLQVRQRSHWQHTAGQLDALTRVLGGFDPSANLRRGYAIVRRDERVVRSVRQVPAGSGVVIQLADGSLESKVQKTAPGSLRGQKSEA
ncbi:exodeoxyribonuclease VII large subunit [Candidatus Parcubacteria bacterium]|nr:exodeoxyribonuclease VII large subunit [Candidatus Parcubacteria bacterium]